MIKLHISGLIGACMILTGCGGGGGDVEVVDLNKVLDVVSKSFVNFNANEGELPDELTQAQKDIRIKDFATDTAISLNEAQISANTLGFAGKSDGSFEGFADANANGLHDSGEKQLFTVEIDEAGSRFIATDTQNGYQRDAGFSGMGLMAGMLIGSMLGRQRGAGISSNRFSNMRMSPKNYHSAAQSRSTASAKSRSSSGS